MRGLNLNMSKTVGIRLGQNKENICTFHRIKITDKSFKYLGISIRKIIVRNLIATKNYLQRNRNHCNGCDVGVDYGVKLSFLKD